MALRTIKINVTNKDCLDLSGCLDVAVCLEPTPWKDRTIHGLGFVFGKLSGDGTPYIKYPAVKGCCCKKDPCSCGSKRYVSGSHYKHTGGKKDPCCEPVCDPCASSYPSKVCFTYDDAQILEDPSTGNPWEIPCDVQVIPFTCLIENILEIEGGTGGGDFDCADLVASITTRDNPGNPCLKELVLCAGTANETILSVVDTSGSVVSFQNNATNPCILEAVTCDGTVVPIRDFSGYVTGIQDNATDANTKELLGCDGSVVGSFTVIPFDCADLVASITTRDNPGNPCLKELVLCAGTANETILSVVDTSGSVVSFQNNATNPCILEAVTCDGTVVPIRDFSGYVTGIQDNATDANTKELLGCDGSVVGSFTVIPFDCADLVASITTRDNPGNPCLKELVLCAGTANETILSVVDTSGSVVSFQNNATNPCILEAVTCDGTVVPIRDFSGYVTGIQDNATDANTKELLGCDGSVVGSFTVIPFDCADLVASITTRDNPGNPCLKELVLCAGTANETILSVVDTSGSVVSFQNNATNPCILEAVTCDGTVVPIRDFSGYVTGIQDNATDANTKELLGCDGSVVGSFTVIPFDCADLVASITTRDNPGNPCLKELVLCAGTANETILSVVDTSGSVVSFQNNATNPCILEAVTCDGTVVPIRDFSGYVTGIQDNATDANTKELLGCDGSVVGSFTVIPFDCADLVASITTRDNPGNPCLKELVLCAGTANETILSVVDTSALYDKITEVPGECGTGIEFRTCDTALADPADFTITLGDKSLVSQVGHGLGAAGDLVPVKPGAVEGTYELAGYTALDDVACFVAQVIDADSYYLLSTGFHQATGHGLTVGTKYSGAAPGTFVDAATLTDADYIQNALTPISADCIHVTLEEAQPPCPVCCDVQDANRSWIFYRGRSCS